MKCRNVERQCAWVGPIGTLQDHMATCEFALVPCPKQCKDDLENTKHILKKDLEEHLKEACPNRDYQCQYCEAKGTHATITQTHDQTCPKKTVPCPNPQCELTMQRQDVERHVRSTCAYTAIPCKYESIGCDVKVKRRDMPSHEQDDRLHLHMVAGATLQLKSDLRSVMDENARLKANGEQLKSEVAELRKNMLSVVSIFQHSSLKGENKRKLQSATYRLKLAGEPGIYQLTDYQRKGSDEKSSFPAFYSHPRGYRMALDVHAKGNRDGKGSHVSVYVPMMAGEYDDELKWPFLGKVTFTLLNQLEDRNHYSKTLKLTNDEKARVGDRWGYAQFIRHSALGLDTGKNTQYLKDDTLYFRLTVQPEI